MKTLNLLYQKEYAINDKIKVLIPTVGEIIDNEDEYYGVVSLLTAAPIDLMVQLDDSGIDFTELTDYDLFLITFALLRMQDLHLVFGDLDMTLFEFATNEQNGMTVLRDSVNDITIDRAIHGKIATTLRKIHHLERNNRKPGNDEAKKYMLRRAREKANRNRNRVEDSQLESLIIAMVNTEQYKYDYDTTRELTIYQFNESVRQIVKKVDYQNKMHGIYAGTIDPKGLSQKDLNWLVH